MFRRRRPEPEPPASADPRSTVPWASVPSRLHPAIEDALAALDRWRRLVDGQRPGPLRDRLAGWTPRLDDAAQQIVATAVRVGEIEAVLDALGPDDVARDFKLAKRAAAQGDDPPELAALEARFASCQRMINVVEDAETRLRVLDARLGAAVAQAAELSVLGTDDDLTRLDGDLASLTDDLTALRGALGSLD